MIDRIKMVMHILDQKYPEPNFTSVVKKCAMLHIIVRQAASKGHCSQEIVEVAHAQAVLIANQDIPAVCGQLKPKNTQNIKR